MKSFSAKFLKLVVKGTWSTANGVSNNLALERIYWILQICPFWPPELYGHKTIISQRGGGGFTGTPGLPPSYAPDEKKDNSPSLVYVLHTTWNLAFSCPGRTVMAKKMYKKAWCTCRVVALPIHFNLLPFWRSLCRRRWGILKSLMMMFLCCLFWLIINKPQPNL